MQIEMIKLPGGIFHPAHEMEVERVKKFKNGEVYTAEIKLTRNPIFHKKMFVFFKFCFQHWCANKAGLEHMDEHSQFDRFRKDLTILAGFYEQTVRLNGEIRTEAKSLAYANMEADEFERCYNAMINAAIKHIFAGTRDENILNQLQSFF